MCHSSACDETIDKSNTEGEAYLEYELSTGERVILVFNDVNDRDGCHISLEMYKHQLGPIDARVLDTMLTKFCGRQLRPES